MMFKRFSLPALVATTLLSASFLSAQSAANAAAGVEAKGINEWLMRMHEASKHRSYIGTFVVSSSAGAMSSAKIWHVCNGPEQVERVETLTGPPRSIFRHNDRVLTFMPEHKVVLSEKRESLGMFPDVLHSTDGRIANFYAAKEAGTERVAGVDADVVHLIPKDALRFGYRVWAEKKNGLVVKLQTMDDQGKVLEQAAFSELQLGAPVKMDKLVQMMSKVDGYRVDSPSLVKTTADAQGWRMKAEVPGFRPVSCYKRPAVAGGAPGTEPMQWVFSDGLASVSLFVEPHDKQRHGAESSLSLGATQTLTRRLDAYWLTVVGEAPLSTLRLFADSLERKN